MNRNFIFVLLLLLVGCQTTKTKLFNFQDYVDSYNPHDSGGELISLQSNYDVTFYDLSLTINPEEQSLNGEVLMRAIAKEDLTIFAINLDPVLKITKIERLSSEGNKTVGHLNHNGFVVIVFDSAVPKGETFEIKTSYEGKPRVAPRPPWKGGLTWSKTKDGSPWIATSCQGEGPDLWWPVKDHVSDEPDSMAIHVTVPKGLVVATNGKLVELDQKAEKTNTYHYKVSTPINTYCVALNIAPYENIEREFTSIAGDKFPVVFYVLPENREKGEKLMEEILDHLKFFEEELGPYPFRKDKYGVAETPHLGMEHQTIIAYGAKYNNGAMTGGLDFGFDVLHHHELSHEWWGNLVTNTDWSDMWIHEGFGTYMQPLYLERRKGKDEYLKYLESILPRVSRHAAVAPKAPVSSKEVKGGAIYFKGGWALHTLRYALGDEVFFKALRRFAYPTKELEAVTDGSQCRYATTEDFIQLVNQLSGKDMRWFFDIYIRSPDIPILVQDRSEGKLSLKWMFMNEEVDSFPMPIPVEIDGVVQDVQVTLEGVDLAIKKDAEVKIDPKKWVLRQGLLPVPKK